MKFLEQLSGFTLVLTCATGMFVYGFDSLKMAYSIVHSKPFFVVNYGNGALGLMSWLTLWARGKHIFGD